MSISIEEVEKIAKLARLKFTDEQKQKMQTELSDILNYVDQLKEIEGAGASVDAIDKDALNLMRDDVADELALPEDFLQQAPGREGNYFKVKSVLE